MHGSRAVLTVPLGGLNDALCQIDKALRFAEDSGRELVIGASFSGLLNEFDDVFEIVDARVPVTGRLSSEVLQRLDSLSTEPAGLQGELLDTFWTPEALPTLPAGVNPPIRLPRSESASADVVVHHQQGGGNRSQRLLQRLQLTPGLAAKVSSGVHQLPSDYVAAHVRHTDYSTDLDWFLTKLREKAKHRPVAILSDNAAVLEAARLDFPSAQILTIPQRLQTDGSKPLHLRSSHHTEVSRHDALLDSLVSLAVLSGARRLFYPTVQELGKFGQPIVSGFSRLAAFLFENQDVRSQFFRHQFASSHRLVGRKRAELLAPVRTKILMRQAKSLR